MGNPVAWFEVVGKDGARLRRFYSDVFGWRIGGADGQMDYGLVEAAAKQVSQFEPAITKYRTDWEPEHLAKLKEYYRQQHEKKDGHYVEPFRYATGFNQK